MNIAIRNNILRFVYRSVEKCPKVVSYSTKTEEPAIPVNPLKDVYSASSQPENGVVYDKKPFKYLCEVGKTYTWCLCGHSRNQPFCDGTHRQIHRNIKLKPIRFTVTETKEYWICNCKQTSNRPFCDGTHKTLEYKKN
ncbi:hypothetical protein KM043_011766 [Ampulex compressa]|nr:hypothetical protein KM043_011766 [Ampulex compressa]